MVSTALDPSSSAALARVATSERAYFFTKFYWGPAILARIGL
jgi:hypothetical protein